MTYERCDSFTVRNEIMYYCRRKKGHAGSHRKSFVWQKGINDE